MDMTVSRWKPRDAVRHFSRDDGTIDCEVRTHVGLVKVFSFPGDANTSEFTTLEMWLSPYNYRITLPRYYKPRWIARLAREFAHQCEYDNGQG